MRDRRPSVASDVLLRAKSSERSLQLLRTLSISGLQAGKDCKSTSSRDLALGDISPKRRKSLPTNQLAPLLGLDTDDRWPSTCSSGVSTPAGTPGTPLCPSQLHDDSNAHHRTSFGALPMSCVPENEEVKQKKHDAVDECRNRVPVSLVRAVAISDVNPGGNVKVVHFVRHGEGTSNCAAKQNGRAEYKSERWMDARLTAQGRKQALEIGEHVAKQGIPLDLLVVSPLRRAAVTGCLAFSSSLLRRPEIPTIAHELLRERAHGNPCDRRCELEELQREIPTIDFSLCPVEDPLRDCVGERGERWEDTAERAREFLRWLSTRKETHIGVATHSAFLLVLFRLVLRCDETLRDWFETGELRSVALIFPEHGGV
eukprot:Hpha_TRINITY_DN13761_c0_g1::TRINITY_DN13761_c0_g1_i2::g.142840::m.142840